MSPGILTNDLNTSLGVTALYEVLKAPISDGAKRQLLGEFDQVLGLSLLERAEALREKESAPQEGDGQIEELIQARQEARAAKNWAEADRIRDELKAMGVVLKDTPQGVTWTRA